MSINKQISITSRGIILHDGKILMVQMPHNGFYCLPGGKLEIGEDPTECLKREIVEELGVEPEVGRLIYINTFYDKEGNQGIDFIFEILNGSDYLNLDGVERTHAFELSDMRWIDKHEDVKILPNKLAEDFRNDILILDKVRFIK